MKIFLNKKVQRKFMCFYLKLTDKERELMGRYVRKLAGEKIVEPDTNEFYITEKDIENIYEKLRL